MIAEKRERLGSYHFGDGKSFSFVTLSWLCCCVLRKDALSLLGGFEQAVNLVNKNSKKLLLDHWKLLNKCVFHQTKKLIAIKNVRINQYTLFSSEPVNFSRGWRFVSFCQLSSSFVLNLFLNFESINVNFRNHVSKTICSFCFSKGFLEQAFFFWKITKILFFL